MTLYNSKLTYLLKEVIHHDQYSTPQMCAANKVNPRGFMYVLMETFFDGDNFSFTFTVFGVRLGSEVIESIDGIVFAVFG